MKKILSTIVLLLVFVNVASASTHGEYKGNPIVKIVVDGKEIKSTGTPAYADDGSVMVPISTLRQLGFDVDWDSKTYSVNVTPPEPITIKEPVKNTLREDAEGAPPTTGGTDQTTTETEPSAETPTSPAPDNTAACQSIRDSYGSQIALVGYEGGAEGPKRNKILVLQYERDKALANSGC